MAPLKGDQDVEPDICDFDGDPHAHLEHNPYESEPKKYKLRIVWRNVILFVLLHLGSLYGIYLLVFKAKWSTCLWTWFLSMISGLGITAGAHRLWAHKSYKAKTPLKIILIIFNNVAFQNDIIEWARDHRVHHKYSETDADPHNAKRGFFFSHMGWLLVRKHPDVKEKGAKFNIDDLTSDPLLMFQRRYYKTMVLLFCFVLPTVVPKLWGESMYVAFYTAALLRYCYTLHVTWCINSVAHMWGFRPYDKHISPRQNIATAVYALGEGWHNYHHVFPFDYRASEFAWTINPTTAFIDFFCRIGWAYDRKVVTQETIDKKKLKHGE